MITHYISLNVRSSNPVDTGISLTQGDYGHVRFVMTVKDGNSDLDGVVSAEITFETPNGCGVNGEVTVENNDYIYVIKGNELQAAGKVYAVLTMTFSDGRVSSCGFVFECRRHPESNIDAGPYFGEIEALKSAAENALSDANGAVAQANAAKNAAEIAAGNAEAVAGIGIATTEKAGISKPDGTTLGIDAAGILRVLESGLKIKDTNGLIGTVNADVFLQSLIDDITNRVVNQILTKSMLINNGLATEAGKYPLDAAYGKTLLDKITQLNSDIQYGEATIENGKGTITFPHAFSNIPSICAVGKGSSDTVGTFCKISSVSKSSVGITVYEVKSGSFSLPSYKVAVTWIAIGKN